MTPARGQPARRLVSSDCFANRRIVTSAASKQLVMAEKTSPAGSAMVSTSSQSSHDQHGGVSVKDVRKRRQSRCREKMPRGRPLGRVPRVPRYLNGSRPTIGTDRAASSQDHSNKRKWFILSSSIPRYIHITIHGPVTVCSPKYPAATPPASCRAAPTHR